MRLTTPPGVSAAAVTTQIGNADSTYLQTGLYGGPQNILPTITNTVVNLRQYLVRFTVPRTLVILSGGFGVSTAANNDDSCRIGIYDATITTLLASSVSTAGQLNATGNKIIQLQASVTLSPGNVYYSSIICAVAGTGAAIGMGQWSSAFFLNTFAATAGAAVAAPTLESGFVTQATVTLPAPPGGTLAALAAGPILTWRTTT